MKHALILLALAGVACERVPPVESRVAPNIDAELASEIARIKAIDNHAHPVRPVAAGEAPDTEYDALPVEHLEPSTDPVRTRSESPELAEAHFAFSRGGKATPAAVLDQLGIEVMLANRVAMGPGLPAGRFLWVPYADALMYPLPNQSLHSNSSMLSNPDRQVFFALEEKLLRRYFAESGIGAPPSTLDEYLTKVVHATLVRQRQAGAVAEKFEMAYLRPLDIGNPSKARAEAAWMGKGDYKDLQDYIFRFIAAECGELGMAVHFHVAAMPNSPHSAAMNRKI